MKKFIEKLDKNVLSEQAADYIANCDYQGMVELFGDCNSVEEVEQRAKELLEDEQ